MIAKHSVSMQKANSLVPISNAKFTDKVREVASPLYNLNGLL